MPHFLTSDGARARSSTMELVCSTKVDDAEYGQFLDAFASQPGTALAYHYPFYLRFLAETAYPGSVPRFVTVRSGAGDLVGVLPGLHVQTSRVSVWLSLAYFGPNAGALVRGHDTPSGAEFVRALVGGAYADACDRGCGSMTIYTPIAADPGAYRAGLGTVDFEVPRTTQWMTIPASADQSPWPRKVRYDMRRAASLGVSVRAIASVTELDVVWDIYHARCTEGGIPIKPRDHVRRLFETAHDQGVFLVAEQRGAILAGLICLMGGGVLSYYLPCSRRDKRALQPGLLLLDHAVAIGRARGCRLLNFEASPSVASSVVRFKARCGAQPADYRILVKLLHPGVADHYRALTTEGLQREAPHAFVVPFDALK